MAGVLDMEVGTAFASLRAGFDWWIGELGELAQPLLRRRGGGGRGLVAVAGRDGEFTLYRNGVALGPPDRARATAAALALPADSVLVREAPAPGLTQRDWRRLLLNDIDRLTPFVAQDVYATVRFGLDEAGAPLAELVAAPRPGVGRLLAQAGAAGVVASALLVDSARGEPIDLLASVRADGGVDHARPQVSRWWLAVAALIAVNLGLAIWRDVRATDQLRQAVARQQPVAERLQRLRRQEETEAQYRRTMIAQRTAASPLRVLAVVTADLPDGAWVDRLGYDQGVLRLSGHHRPGVDVAAALQADRLFSNVRNASADLSPGEGSGETAAGEAFDLMADVDAAAPTRRGP